MLKPSWRQTSIRSFAAHRRDPQRGTPSRRIKSKAVFESLDQKLLKQKKAGCSLRRWT
nr:hypothetical protein [Pseudomonas syringae pv. actinidiae]